MNDDLIDTIYSYYPMLDLALIKDKVIILDYDSLEVGFCTYQNRRCFFSAMEHLPREFYYTEDGNPQGISCVVTEMTLTEVQKYPDPLLIKNLKRSHEEYRDLMRDLQKKDNIIGWYKIIW